MFRWTRLPLVLTLVAGVLPATLGSSASAHHDGLPSCAAERRSGYIEVAQSDPLDATTLHFQVFLPDPARFPKPDGGYPAVMDYSGYQPGLHIWDGLHRDFLCQGYAVIGLNIRGTGCSGGSFDYFEPRQAEDGRQAIEWFNKEKNKEALDLNGRIAMVGKSYPGITQLFVAGQPFDDDGNGRIDGTPPSDQAPGTGEWDTTPDGLVALVPGHVFGDLYRDVPYPGGIMNVTFASYWSAQRIVEPFQAPLEDQVRRQAVDAECMRNTADHVANPPQNPFVKALYNHYDDPHPWSLFKERSPWNWADAIDVPTFLVQTWQDEQVGSRASELIERFRTDLEWRALFTNGDHGEYYEPGILPEIFEFLSFYLAGEVPASFPRGTVTETVEVPCPDPTPTLLPNGKPKRPKKPHPRSSPTEPETCSGSQPRDETDEEVLDRYEAESPVQINWETGRVDADGSAVLTPQKFSHWPAQDVWRLYFRPAGSDGPTLAGSAPTEDDAGDVTYRYDPVQGSQARGYPIEDVEVAKWDERPAEGTFAMFETAPIPPGEAKVIGGPASVDLWLSSTTPDTDLQVTLTEIRPDGQEMFVQQGWLRASHRTLDESQSTEIRPFHTHESADAALAGPLIPDVPAAMRVEIFPFAHIFREGSRLRLYVEAPHVKPDYWGFALLPTPAMNTIHISPDEPSSIALPLLGGAEIVPAEIASHPEACTLHNQPCREDLFTTEGE